MIIELLLDVIYTIMSKTIIISIPPLPEQAQIYIDQVFEYIVAGAGVLANYVPLDYLIVMFTVLLAVDAGILVYHLVLWVLKKIPVAGIE